MRGGNVIFYSYLVILRLYIDCCCQQFFYLLHFLRRQTFKKPLNFALV